MDYPYGNHLTGNVADCNIEFIGAADPATNRIRPVRPLDPRLSRMTAQYYAASSYGPVHVSLNLWTDRDLKTPLDSKLDPTKAPMYSVLSDWRLGLTLGAMVHRVRYRQVFAETGGCQPCSQEQLDAIWSEAFQRYNPGDPSYGQKIVDRGRNHDRPRE